MRMLSLNTAVLALVFAAADKAGSGAKIEQSLAATEPSALPAILGDVKLPKLQQFDATAPEKFGNALLASFAATDAFDAALAEASVSADNTKKFIGFELTRAVMAAAETSKDINLFAIFDGKVPTEKLLSKLLQYFGVIKKEIKDEEVVTTWTAPEVEATYNYGAIDKEKDEAEYTKRFNNRKRLNMRLSDAIKAAVALIGSDVKAAQLTYSENSTTKEVEPVIKDAPEAIRGDKDKNGSTVKFGSRSANEGAKVAANMAALVKAAVAAHSKDEDEKAKASDKERADKGSERPGDAKITISDEEFGGIVNNTRRVIAALEGTFSADVTRQLIALREYITEQLTAADLKAQQAKAAALAGDKA